jgi:hypothetical protein
MDRMVSLRATDCGWCVSLCMVFCLCFLHVIAVAMVRQRMLQRVGHRKKKIFFSLSLERQFGVRLRT